MYVGMRYVIALYAQVHAPTAGLSLQMLRKFLNHLHQMREDFLVQLSKLFNLLLWYNQNMSRLYWVNVQKCQKLVIFVDFVARNFSPDDSRKD